MTLNIKFVPRKVSSVYMRQLVIGEPGSGKTRFASTCALDERTYPCLYLECAANPETAFTYERLPVYITIQKLTDMDVVYDFLLKGQMENHPFAKALMENDLYPNQPFKSIVIDGLHSIQQMASDDVDRLEKASTIVPWAKRERRISDIPITATDASGLRAYRALKSQQSFQAFAFYSLNMHVIMTVLKDDRVNPLTNKASSGALLDGRSKEIFPAFCNLVGVIIKGAALKKEDLASIKAKSSDILLTYKLRETAYAKDSFNIMPDWIVNPTMSNVLDSMEKNLQHLTR